ncbi:MAG: MMPL family transporter [Actinomycetota bacterium]|nr:MMPL family transporter [Actinomycetota bacterium]
MSVFHSIGVFAYRFRWAILLVWGMVLISSAFFAPGLSGQLKGGGFDGANSEAERVQDLMSDEFGLSPATLTVVFTGDGLPARSEEFQDAQENALAEVRKLDDVRQVISSADAEDPRFISEDGMKSYAVVTSNVSVDATRNVVDEVRSKVRSGELETYVTGAPAVYQDLEEASNEDVKEAEKYAFPFAVIILIFAFGTLVAAGVPVLIGGASVVTALATLYFIAGVYDMSVFTLTLSTMLGLGLGIDYALFFVSRFREELEDYPTVEAVPRTVATAGRSIFFSGTAVLIGLSGLLFFPFMFMRSIGVAGVVVVFISVLAALTLLPALLGVLGPRINRLAIRRPRDGAGSAFWSRSAEVVMRRPLAVILLAAAILGTLLYPVGHMKVGIPEATVLPQEYESRAGDDILKSNFEYAALNPMEIVATLEDDPLSARGLSDTRELGENISGADGVSRVESVYTLAAAAAEDYAGRLADAREQARKKAASRVDAIVQRQIEEQTQNETDRAVNEQLSEIEADYGAVPPGTEERLRTDIRPRVESEVRASEGRIRDEVERRLAEEVDRKVPDLPEGISADGTVTPEGVANFLNLPAARRSEDLQDTLDTYVAGDRTLLRGVTEANPYTQGAYGVVDAVRAVEAPDGTSFLVGGLSAGQKDFISSLYDKAPLAAAFVIGVTYLILLLTFRSVLLPLKAVIVNILSLTASFGALVFVFQDGNLSGLLDFTPLGFVDATLPILMFCTIFGVSMDYEVFLLSRIREAYENGDSNAASVSKGLVATAGIITSAAAIIIVVTGAFALTGIVLTKAIGLGLAVAVFVDATIVRILLVPATMRILGDWNWWPGGRKVTFGADPEEIAKDWPPDRESPR